MLIVSKNIDASGFGSKVVSEPSQTRLFRSVRMYPDGSHQTFESASVITVPYRRATSGYFGPKERPRQFHECTWTIWVQDDPMEAVSYNPTPDGSYSLRQGPASRFFESWGPLVGQPSTFPSVNFDGKLQNKVLSKFADTTADLGASVVELGSTVRSITGIATSITQSYRMMKRGNFRGALKFLGSDPAKHIGLNAANAWLQWRYAVRPLMFDAQDLAATLAYSFDKEAVVVAHSARAEETSVFRHLAGDSPGQPFLADTVFTYTISKIMYIEAVVAGPGQRIGNQVGLFNPLSVGWEVLPLSFVSDWFVNIGEYLRLLSATVGLTFKTGYTTSKAQYTEIRGSYRKVETVYQRQAVTGFPSPALLFDPHLTFGRCLDSLSLLRTTIRGR